MNQPVLLADPGKRQLFLGIPKNGENPRKFKEDGGKLMWILTPEEQAKFDTYADEPVLVWVNDAQFRRSLFDRFDMWVGVTLVGDMERMPRVAAILKEIVELNNFENRSAEILTKDRQPTRNALRNFKWVDDGIAIKRVRGRGKGIPAVLIAAGPSLNSQWGLLRELRKAKPGIPFIIVGRTYKKAMAEGVWPDFVVEVEQYEWDSDIFMFAPEPPPDCIFAFTLAACPKLARVWQGPKMALVDHNTAQLFEPEMKLHEDSVDGGNSVLHHCFNVAKILGSNPLYLAGVDFGYPNGTAEETHATGTFHAWPGDILKAENIHQEALELPANDGGMVRSSQPYRNFGTLLSVQIERAKMTLPELQVFSFSPRGLKVDGVVYKDLKETLCESLPKLPVPPSESGPSASVASSSASSSTGG